MESLLQQDSNAKAQVDVLTKRFAADPEGPLNGSVHAALQSQSTSEGLYNTRVADDVTSSVPRNHTKSVTLYVCLFV